MLHGTEAHIHIFEGATRHSPHPSDWVHDTKVLTNIRWWETSLPHSSPPHWHLMSPVCG